MANPLGDASMTSTVYGLPSMNVLANASRIGERTSRRRLVITIVLSNGGIVCAVSTRFRDDTLQSKRRARGGSNTARTRSIRDRGRELGPVTVVSPARKFSLRTRRPVMLRTWMKINKVARSFPGDHPSPGTRFFP